MNTVYFQRYGKEVDVPTDWHSITLRYTYLQHKSARSKTLINALASTGLDAKFYKVFSKWASQSGVDFRYQHFTAIADREEYTGETDYNRFVVLYTATQIWVPNADAIAWWKLQLNKEAESEILPW